MKKDNFTLISCYTDMYTIDAELLKKSLKQFNLNNTQIEKYNDKGNWKANLKQKPIFIKQKLQELKSPVVWTDADSVLLQYPEYFNTLNCDIAIWRSSRARTPAGTMYFNYSTGAFTVLNHWINNYRDSYSDGKNLTETLNKIAPTFMKQSTKKDEVKISKLPFTYNYFHIDDYLYEQLLNNKPVDDFNDLNIVFAHTRGYHRYFKNAKA